MASPELQAVLSSASNFEMLVAQLLVTDNAARSHAEGLFQQSKEHADACVSHLTQILRTSGKVEHKQFCAVMLRKVLTKEDPPVWTKCSPNVQAMVKTELLKALKEEETKAVLHKVNDTVSDLGVVLMDNNSWPELVPALFEMVQTGHERLISSALSVFAELALYVVESLIPAYDTIQQMLGATMGHPSLEVQLASLRVISAFIQSVEEPSQRDKLQGMVGGMLACLGRTLTSGDEASAQEALTLFIDVAEAHPRFLRKQLGEVVQAMLQVALAEQLESDTRRLAMEFLVTMCEAREKAPGMMRKLPQLADKLYEALMLFLLDIEDEALWHSAEDEAHEEEGAGELCDFGQECLDRVAISLGGNSIVPAAARLLPAWLGDADWRKRHAALICLAQIAEGCSKQMTSQLPALTDMCMKGLADSHAKVRWASCQALGQMCTDLGPEIQESQHAKIVPGLMALMDDFANPRVQAHASAAIVNFSENCEKELLVAYLDTLIHKLLLLLQNGKRLVQEGALTAMASVADCAQDMFIKYYDSVMPLLLNILMHANDKSQRLLRAKTVESISLVGMAVGKERFREDAAKLMTFLQTAQMAQLDNDDPLAGYMLQAGARLCKCLGDEFLPYLPIVMPALLKSAQIEADIKIRDLDEEDDEDEEDDDVESFPLGDKVVSIRTSGLEEKATACNMLCCYASELKEGFFPFTKQVTDIMVPLIKFYFHEEVRSAAIRSLPDLLRSSTSALEKGFPGADRSFVAQQVEYMWEPLMAALGKEPEAEVLAALLESLAEMVEMLEQGLLQQAMVQRLFDQVKGVITASEKRRAERLKRQATEDFDEEEAAALEEENFVEEELLDQVQCVMGAFMKKYGDAVLPLVELLMPQVAPMLDKGRNSEERRIAVCIIDDLLEYCPQGLAKYLPNVMPVLLEACGDKHADLRQCSAYGVGVVAEKAPAAFKPYMSTALAKLSAIINDPDARSEDNECATDNAIAALGNIVAYHADSIDNKAVPTAWVNALPVKGDAVEAQKQHELLAKLVAAQDQRVLGEGNSNLPKIVSVFVQVLGRGTELVSEQAGRQMVALLQQLQASVPQQLVVSTVQELSEKQQANFNTYMSGNVPAA